MKEDKMMTLMLEIPFYAFDKIKVVSAVNLQFHAPEVESNRFIEENLTKVSKKLEELHKFALSNQQELDYYNEFAYAVLHIFTHACRYDLSGIQYSTYCYDIMRSIKEYAKHLNAVIQCLDPTTTSSKEDLINSFMSTLLKLDLISHDVCTMLYVYLYERGFSGGACETMSSTGWIQ